MRITETVSAVECPRLIARTRRIGTRRLLVAVREQQLEPAGEGSCGDHITDWPTGVLGGGFPCVSAATRAAASRRWATG
ncbi:MAG: hypothetical protein OYK82_01030 [Gammaproteobacteria bacterium]|nr:hypothetical protein [Gammaproteobacteria bacterium]